jgi:hypothetical protein
MVGNDTFTAVVPRELEEDTDFLNWIDAVDGSQLLRIEAAREKKNITTNWKW